MTTKESYLVRHQHDVGAVYTEYQTLEAAEVSAEFLIKAHAGAATVFAVRELCSFWRGADLRRPSAVNPTGGVE